MSQLESSDFLKGLARALDRFDRGARRGLTDLADIIADQMRQSVEVDTGTTKRSIKVEPGRDVEGAYVDITSGGASVFLEFGTSKMRARPFFRPAVAKSKRRASSALRQR